MSKIPFGSTHVKMQFKPFNVIKGSLRGFKGIILKYLQNSYLLYEIQHNAATCTDDMILVGVYVDVKIFDVKPH